MSLAIVKISPLEKISCLRLSPKNIQSKLLRDGKKLESQLSSSIRDICEFSASSLKSQKVEDTTMISAGKILSLIFPKHSLKSYLWL